jgi:uncharacterized repeat protein (TIGR03803 family)
MTRLSVWRKIRTIFVLCAATAIAAPAQTFNTLLDFDGSDGGNPWYGSLLQSTDGNFYGTTLDGGANQYAGTIFRITPAGTLTTLYNFCTTFSGWCRDGSGPDAGLIQATDGNFYGTTAFGGEGNAGTAFKVTPTGTLTTLYSFCTKGYTCPDGAQPNAGLLQANNGSFYGTTFYGGTPSGFSSCGTIFKITPAGTMTTLYDFCSQDGDGENPIAGLIQATDGNLYGTTDNTFFRITPAGRLTTLYTFCTQTGCPHGADPQAGLIEGTDGNLYGTTAKGGANGPYDGTVFKITLSGTLTTLYSFCALTNCADGDVPYSGLTESTDGNFYGTTTAGGNLTGACFPYSCGTVFQITASGTLTTLHSFSFTDGEIPYGGLLQATNGIFYGTTTRGANQTCEPVGCGTVFSLSMGLGPFVSFVRGYGKVGQTGGILGQGLTGTTGVSLNGVPASFKVKSDTFLKATVPAGATTGYVTVTTPSGTLTSNVPFHVIP